MASPGSDSPAFLRFVAPPYYFCFCSFCKLFLDFSAASCKFVFSADTILNFFAIFSSFLCSKLNFLPFAANFPPVHYLRNGPALAFL